MVNKQQNKGIKRNRWWEDELEVMHRGFKTALKFWQNDTGDDRSLLDIILSILSILFNRFFKIALNNSIIVLSESEFKDRSDSEAGLLPFLFSQKFTVN